METSDPKYKHKPSEKHTLEEVLKSLQDLIRNDLDETAPAASAEPEPAAAPHAVFRDNGAAGRREDFAPQSPGAGPVNLSAVMRSLKDLIGNELNIGDRPAPESAAPAATHEEYLATSDGIEEYIPEDLDRLDEEPDLGGEFTPLEPEPAAPPIEPSAPEALAGQSPLADGAPEEIAPPADEITAGELPQELTPLDEELTFGESPELAPPPPVASGAPELPGEITPELLGETGDAPPPAAPEPPPARRATPELQQELLLEEPPPIVLRMPPPDTASAGEPEPETAPEPSTDELRTSAESALPAIEVEESFDTGSDADAAAPATETAPAQPEEIIALPAAEPPAEPPPAPEENKITLEIASEPPLDGARGKTSVDFDTLTPEPSPPEHVTPPVAGEVAAPEDELPVIAVEPDPTPAPEQETRNTLEPAPAPETGAGTVPETIAPSPPPESAATGAPQSFTLEDIPVLNEVVTPPAGGVPPAIPAAPLPAPDRARDLVVRAVAKLNVEMRKAGGTGLDTRTILRLQQLIRQELEKSGDK